MTYAILADLTVLLHFLFVLYAVIGATLVLVWRWTIYLHIPACLWAALVMFSGTVCPLTPLENYFRLQAGQEVYYNSFVEFYLLPILYPKRLTRELQLFLGGTVIAMNAIAYTVVIRKWRVQVSKED